MQQHPEPELLKPPVGGESVTETAEVVRGHFSPLLTQSQRWGGPFKCPAIKDERALVLGDSGPTYQHEKWNLMQEAERYCTCRMRSPSRMRPSLAAMLFGLICGGRGGQNNTSEKKTTRNVTSRPSVRGSENVLTHYSGTLQRDTARL